MSEVILVIHLILCLALIGTILLQRSEGGALGMGGGGMMTGRGSANLLSRTTAILAVGFIITSVTLTVLGKKDYAPRSVIDNLNAGTKTKPVTPAQAPSIFDKLQPETPKVPTPPKPGP